MEVVLQTLGPIRADELYPAQVFRARLGLEKKSWASLKRAGLRTVQQGRYCYVLGKDALDLFDKLAARQAATESEAG